MDLSSPQQLRYRLKYGGHAAGEQRLTLEPRGEGMRLTLEATVELPQPRTRQRWESDVDKQGFPRRYRERVEGGGSRLMEVDFSRSEGLVSVRQGKEDFAIPYLAEMHDPLSLIWAVGALRLEVGEVKMFSMVGGRAYAERLADQNLTLSGQAEQAVRVFRLRPGLSFLYFNAEDHPVQLTQKVGEHVFEAELLEVGAIDARQIGRGQLEPTRAPQERERGRSGLRGNDAGRPRVVSGEPTSRAPQPRQTQPNPSPSKPDEEGKEKTGEGNRRRRRRRRYS